MKKQWKKALLVMTVAICMVVSAVLSVSAATTTDANAGTIKVLSSGVVSQAYSEISAYRADGNYTAPGTPSGYSDYVFAGWFTNEACTTETTATSGSAYAKFVVKDVLGVKAQFLAGTTYESATSNMRFVTTVDSLDYEAVGFKCVINGVTKYAESSDVYRKLYAAFSKEEGSAISTLLPSSFSEETSKYFMACILKNIPNADFGDAIEVTPYWVTLDGTTVYGDTVMKTVNNGYMEVSTGVTVQNAVAFDYSSTYSSYVNSSYSYAVQGGCIGVVDGKTYYYQAMTESNNDHSYIMQIDMETGAIVKGSTALSLGHTNDITYNKDLDVLVVCQNAPNNERISFVNPSTLEIVAPSSTGATFGDGVTVTDTYITTSHEETTKILWWTQTTDVENNLFSIEYNSYQQKYVVGISGGQTFRILDADFSDPNASGDAFSPTANTSGFTTQGVVADDSYIYFVLYHDGEVDNASYEGHVIAVYDWNGNYVTVLEIPTTSIAQSVEPENIAIYDNAMYISCQNKKIYRVADFEISTSEFEAKIENYYSDADDTTGYFKTLEEAVEAVQDGQTITILSEKVSVSKNLNIDNANVTITNEPGVNVVVKKGADFSGILISNNANGVKIQSAETGSLTFTGNGYSGSSLVYNYADATLALDNVTFKNIESSGSGSAVHVNGGTVRINKCNFENNTASNQGGALWVASETEVTVTNSKFTGNSTVNQTGGAVYATSQNMTVTGTDFIRNESATTAGAINNGGIMTITDCDFTENKANSGNGGAVQVADGGQATINGTGAFTNNSATDAGGALRVNNAKLTVSGQTFDSNTSGSTGGAVDIQNGTFDGAYEDDAYVFTNNTFVSNTAGTTGGAIYNAARELQITDCTFGSTEEVAGTDEAGNPTTETVALGNTATTYGGALYLNASKVTITDSEFNVNKAAGNNGGAIYFKGELSLNNTDFTGNEAKGTGGAFHSEGGTAIADSCDFTSNKAGGNGGACRVVAGGSAKFTGTGAFTGNESTGAVGGAIQVNSATLSVTGYTFDNNTSKTDGGAVYIQENTKSASFTSSTFVNNSVTAGNGGAIYAQKDVTITDTNFVANTASENGGAIYATNAKAVTLTKTGETTPTITGNSAVLGGAIYTPTGTINATGYAFNSNSAANGGAICIGEVIETVTEGTDAETGEATSTTTYTYNAGTLNATSCSFDGNISTNLGGAVYSISGNTTITGTSTTFTRNEAATGGAIYQGRGAMVVSDATFDDNYASGNGGAIYLPNASSGKISSSVFKSNEAGADGGAIYNVSKTKVSSDSTTTLLITSCTFGGEGVGNKAGTNAGAIYSGQSSYLELTVDENSSVSPLFEENNSNGGNGGGAINVGSGIFKATGYTFKNNKANATQGGAIRITSGNTTTASVIDDCIFSGNTSKTSGGAIYKKGLMTISNSDFSGNSAGSVGGAINLDADNTTIQNCNFNANDSATNASAIQVNGGEVAIEVTDSGNYTFNGNTSKATSGTNGGAIYITGSGSLTIRKTEDATGTLTFTNNTARYGGAIFVNTGSFSIDGVIFNSNTGTVRGGAIYTTKNASHSTIANSDFSGNKATGGGGGAIFKYSSIDIENTDFTSNKSSGAGGAIGNEAGNMIVRNCDFITNIAGGNGGAMQIVGTSTVTIEVTDGETHVFQGNSGAAGGALRINNTNLTITGYSFVGNSATGSGQSINDAGSNTTLTLNQCTFDQAQSTAVSGTIDTNNGTEFEVTSE